MENCAELAIMAVNDTFPELGEFPLISLDNIGSHKTVDGWLARGVPPEAIPQLVAKRARKWNTGRAGGLPRSLGHPWFKNGVPADWRLEKIDAARGQLALTLLTEEKVAVPTLEARPSDVALESGPPPAPPQPSVPLSENAIAAMRAAFENPGRRTEVA